VRTKEEARSSASHEKKLAVPETPHRNSLAVCHFLTHSALPLTPEQRQVGRSRERIEYRRPDVQLFFLVRFACVSS
jgi:hypothetical protein